MNNKLSAKGSLACALGLASAISCNTGKKPADTTQPADNDTLAVTSFVTPAAGTVALSSISNEEEVIKHMNDYPDRWKAVKEFLESNALDSLADGEYQLLPDKEVFVAVSTYVPRDTDQCNFESHKVYIDLQYLATGREVMGVTRDSSLTVLSPFTDGVDFATYSHEGSDAVYEAADSSRYYVFFPADLHRPCIRIDGPEDSVHKVVVKIKYAD